MDSNNQNPIAKSLKNVKHKIAIFSGKGGVGKTTTTVNLAVTLAGQGYKVAILDADVHGPAVPKILGAGGKLDVTHEMSGANSHGHTGHHHHSGNCKSHEHTGDDHHNGCNNEHGGFSQHQAHDSSGDNYQPHSQDHNHALRFEPVQAPSGVKMVSVDSIWPEWENPVMWRGPFKSRVIRQFLSAINWGELDYLFIDLPPGTGDEVLTIMSSIPGLDGMVVVSTPQDISTAVCHKAINTAKEMGVPILGVVENMSIFCCPHCQNDIRIFGQRSAVQLARMIEVDFLGSIPFLVEVNESSDQGIPVVTNFPDSSVAHEVARIAGLLVAKVNKAGGGERDGCRT